MKILLFASALLVCALLAGCGGDGNDTHPAPPGPAPTEQPVSDVMRVGDKITVRLTGVPEGEYFDELQIPVSGDISLPLLSQSFHATGLNPAELASDITEAYKSEKIYTNPVVTVLPEDRYVNVGGDVRSPTRVVYTADATVMSTINSCGGFDEYANKRAVRILRGQKVLYVDCVKASTSAGDDPPVYPGDQIYVPRTPF